MTSSSKAPFAVATLSLLLLGGAIATAAVLHQPPATDGEAAGPGPGGSPGLSVSASPGRLTAADSCDDLLTTFHDLGSRAVGEWGWRYGGYYSFADDMASLNRAEASIPADGAHRTAEQTNSDTGTNVQEVGIDEPDVAKTDGTILVRVDRRTLTTYDVSGAQVRRLGSLKLPGRLGNTEVLLHGDRALVIGQVWGRSNGSSTRLIGIDLTAPATPGVSDVHEFDGDLLSARLTGGDVRIVTSRGLPELDFVHPTRNRTRKEARRENRRIVRESTIDDWLPQVTDDGTGKALLDCGAVNVPEDEAAPGVLSVVGFPIGDPVDRDVTAVLTDSQIVYTSPDRLYLATNGWGCCGNPFIDRIGGGGSFGGNTDLHAFTLSGTEAIYAATGRLKGTVADRWSLDSVDGVLRVALAVPAAKEDGKRMKAHNAVVTMKQVGGLLEEAGRVDGLGVNEDIQSVRWFDDFAVVVTFRQVDPLYAIDLSDQEDPQLLGELKIPGFSSYLHPIGEDRLLGIGTDANKRGRSLGGQASTFDVSDPSAPTQVDKVTYGRNTEMLASWEPRQFTWLPERETALTPVLDYSRNGTGKFSLAVLEVSPRAPSPNTKCRSPAAGPSSPVCAHCRCPMAAWCSAAARRTGSSTGETGPGRPGPGTQLAAYRLAARARALAASTSRSLGGAVVTRSASRCSVTWAISATARSKAA